MPRRVFITVGEVSGDQHAANFARQLRELDPTIIIEGLGGPAMAAAGVTVHHDTVRRSAMGLKALLRAWEVRGLLRWTRDYYEQHAPDLHVCIDSWSMNWHFADLAKKQGTKVLYYIAPQAWASRPGRVKRLRQCVDQLACILPFEEEWFGSRGVKTLFVGHPLFDHLPTESMRPTSTTDLAARPPIIGLLPGSRRGIARGNFPGMVKIAAIISRQFPGARFLVPTTASTAPVVNEILSQTDSAPFTVKQDSFDELVPTCDLCITVSGTSTLHVAGYGVPMIVVYRGSRILWHLLGRWIINTRTYALVNLLHDQKEHLVPEFIPWYGNPEPIAAAAIEMLKSPGKLSNQRQSLRDLVRTLDKPGASRNVAMIAMNLMQAAPESA